MALAVSLRAYRDIVEPAFQYPPYREAASVDNALRTLSLSCEDLCELVWSLEPEPGGRACIITPALEVDDSGLLEACDALLVADSASRILERVGQSADYTILVTDLDGGFEALRKTSIKSRLVAVHAHGDNQWLHPYIPDLHVGSGRILLTSQTPAPQGYPVLAPFGFTDGDRALLIALVIGYDELLVAWSPRPSPKPWGDPSWKEAKIRIALKLVDAYTNAFGYRCRLESPTGLI